MGISLTATEKAAMRRDMGIFEAAGAQHLDELLEALQSQLDNFPIDGTITTGKLADDAVTAAKLATAVVQSFAVIDWGTPAAESGNAIEVLLQLVDLAGDNLEAERVFEAHVADTEHGGDSATATIAAADTPVGSIISGTGTAAVKIKTDTNGQVKLKVSETAASDRFLTARPCHGSPMLNCVDSAELPFA